MQDLKTPEYFFDQMFGDIYARIALSSDARATLWEIKKSYEHKILSSSTVMQNAPQRPTNPEKPLQKSTL